MFKLIVKCRKANVTRIKINKTFHTADSFASSADKNKERYTNLSDYFVCLLPLLQKEKARDQIREKDVPDRSHHCKGEVTYT